MYGSHVAFRNHHGGYLCVDPKSRRCHSRARSPLDTGAVFTVARPGGYKNEGVLLYGDNILLKVENLQVVDSIQITYLKIMP
jgi:hypothetical protein